MSWNPFSLICGFQFGRNWIIMDKLGSIIDALLSLQGEGAMPGECFAKIRQSLNGFELLDDDNETTFSLKYSIEGFTVFCDMEADPPLREDSFRQCTHQIADAVFSVLKSEYEIQRIGIVRNYRFATGDKTCDILANNLLKLDFRGIPSEFICRTAYKNYVRTASIMADDNRFKNTFLQFKSGFIEAENSRLEMKYYDRKRPDTLYFTIDHQLYCHPRVKYDKEDLKAHFDESLKLSKQIESEHQFLQDSEEQ